MSRFISRAKGPVATTDMHSTREAALAAGHTFFFTGKPCRRGHIAPRYAASSTLCVECVKLNSAKRRAKTIQELKERYRADPDKYRKMERERAMRDPKRYWVKNTISKAAARAEKTGVAFDLDVEYILGILTEECPIFGTPFVFVGNKHVCAESASLDRLVPAKGYVKGNVVVISHLANTIKQNVTAREVAKVAQWMYEQGL